MPIVEKYGIFSHTSVRSLAGRQFSSQQSFQNRRLRHLSLEGELRLADGGRTVQIEIGLQTQLQLSSGAEAGPIDASGSFSLETVLETQPGKLVVIGLAATATATGMRATTNLLGMNEKHSRAITLTQAAIEDLRTVDYDDIIPGSKSTEDGFTTTWTIQGSTPGPGMKLITATTSWKWRDEQQNYTLHTVYSRISPN